jgi:hypothetical protein
MYYLKFITDIPKMIEGFGWWFAGIFGVGKGLRSVFKCQEKTVKFISIHQEINERLTELRKDTNSMRTCVLQFHNGGYFMDGISMMKFSITHESCHKGYTRQAAKLKDSQCTLFINLLAKMMEDKAQIYTTNSFEKSNTARFLEDEFVSHVACLPLKNKNTIIGFVMVQWHKDYSPDVVLVEKMMSDFVKQKDSIEMQLSYQKN